MISRKDLDALTFLIDYFINRGEAPKRGFVVLITESGRGVQYAGNLDRRDAVMVMREVAEKLMEDSRGGRI